MGACMNLKVCLRNLLVNIMNLSVLHLSIPNHSRLNVFKKDLMKTRDDSLLWKKVTKEETFSANSSWTKGLSLIQKQ